MNSMEENLPSRALIQFFPVLPLMVLFLSACSTCEENRRYYSLNEIHRNRSTEEDVVARLGQPTTERTLKDGQKIMVYKYLKLKADPEGGMPDAELVQGDREVRNQVINIMIGADGYVESCTINSTEGDVNTGLLFTL